MKITNLRKNQNEFLNVILIIWENRNVINTINDVIFYKYSLIINNKLIKTEIV